LVFRAWLVAVDSSARRVVPNGARVIRYFTA
jgi:hypothetical protein